MTTIAVLNEKGGVGKTATAVCLGAAIADRGTETTVVDLDPQADATRWLGVEGFTNSVMSVVDEQMSLQEASAAVSGNLRIVRSTEQLAAIDAPVSSFGGACKSEDGIVLIDCPPTLGPLTITALHAADLVIVPVEADLMSISALQSAKGRITRSQRETGSPDDWKILITQLDERTKLASQVRETLEQRMASRLIDVVIRTNVRIKESFGERAPVTEYAPKSRGAGDYRKLAEWTEAYCG